MYSLSCLLSMLVDIYGLSMYVLLDGRPIWDAEDFKLWPTPIEKHFIDVLVEEEAKGAF